MENKQQNLKLFNFLIKQANLDESEFEITEQFLDQILKNDTDWIDGVINAVICVETDGLINNDSIIKSKRNEQKLSKLPLKGLSKVHVNLPNIQSLAQVLRLDIQMNNDSSNPQITEKDPNKLLKAYKKLTDQQFDPKLNRDRPKISILLEEKRDNDWMTGCWLIYGEHDNKRYYLMIYDGTSHKPDIVDQIVYDQLCQMYGITFLNKFLTK